MRVSIVSWARMGVAPFKTEVSSTTINFGLVRRPGTAVRSTLRNAPTEAPPSGAQFSLFANVTDKRMVGVPLFRGFRPLHEAHRCAFAQEMESGETPTLA